MVRIFPNLMTSLKKFNKKSKCTVDVLFLLLTEKEKM